ncbi:YusW family protein [Bacillus sp. FJAT-49732]|uniref:YusW family protein n=1 Tax=Lederbergia citrisecunda TaxID=2833583 RepID=A0A942TQA3_9BACI|nr:YusW family protein [Lederbergia citrisecunda]MBS4199934.1 YusW family protein [Lederbergia citrisecunda]
MKKVYLPLLGITLIFSLSACSNDPSVDNNPKEQVVPTQQSENANTPDDNSKDNSGNKSVGTVTDDNNATNKMQELNFSKFDLEVQYANDQDFDIEYEQGSNNGDYEAKMEDTINDRKLKGMEAFNTIYTQLKDLAIDANTPKADVIQKVLQRFNLSDNYRTLELEYTFKDGTKMEIKDNK